MTACIQSPSRRAAGMPCATVSQTFTPRARFRTVEKPSSMTARGMVATRRDCPKKALFASRSILPVSAWSCSMRSTSSRVLESSRSTSPRTCDSTAGMVGRFLRPITSARNRWRPPRSSGPIGLASTTASPILGLPPSGLSTSRSRTLSCRVSRIGSPRRACGGPLESVARVGGAERHVEEMGPRCTVAGRTAISPQAFLGDDGLALERDAPFCPDLGTASPADASRCQSVALTCQVDAAVRASVPRAAELLGRLGISLDEDGRCLGPPACGNGDIDGDEECDDGDDNSDRLPDHCRTDCTEPRCGDGVVDSDEECDDGNQTDGDGCAADCTVEPGVCGNGVVDDGEECDDGNQTDGDGCSGDCTIEPGVCGNGVVEDGEEGDDGAANSAGLPDP